MFPVNDLDAPNVNDDGEQNVPTNLSVQSGLPNMSSTKVFTVQTDTVVLGDVYAENFIGNGAAGGIYATQVGFNPNDPLDVASLVMDAGTDGTDGYLNIANITADGTVDFTGATLIGIPDLVGISLTDLSVSVNAVGVANLEYDNTTGVFTYTPPDLSTFLTASSKATLTNKSGSNSQWTNDESYINLTDLSVTVATEGTANLSYDNTNGTLTYTPPSFAGYLPVSGGTLTGSLTTSADINFGDGGKALFGDAGDLEIFHNGAHSYIRDTGTGNLRVTAQNFNIRNAADNESIFTGVDGGAVISFYSGDQKLSTTATGIDVTGSINTTDGVYLGGTAAANLLDDYEEGTWTPTITGSTSGSATLTVNQASYTKVGRSVHVNCYIINADVTGLVGTITVGGLPFTADGFAMTKSGYCTLFSFDQQTTEVAGYTESGADYIRLQKGSSITTISGTDATAAGDGRIMMNFTYQTA